MKLESDWRHLACNQMKKIKYECGQDGLQDGSLLQKY